MPGVLGRQWRVSGFICFGAISQFRGIQILGNPSVDLHHSWGELVLVNVTLKELPKETSFRALFTLPANVFLWSIAAKGQIWLVHVQASSRDSRCGGASTKAERCASQCSMCTTLNKTKTMGWATQQAPKRRKKNWWYEWLRSCGYKERSHVTN